MRSTKKTVSLFQSHVFKHEFFLFPVARSLFPLNKIDSVTIINNVTLLVFYTENQHYCKQVSTTMQ